MIPTDPPPAPPLTPRERLLRAGHLALLYVILGAVCWALVHFAYPTMEPSR
jgi:hypothetical protein